MTRSRILARAIVPCAFSLGAAGFFILEPFGGHDAAAALTAFHGTPISIPGIVQAEDFDSDGAGVAYHDTTPGNSGGQYRSTDVDIQPTTDTGGGYNVGWTAAGEWLAYTVAVASGGTYTLEFRVAARAQGATFHLEVNGADKTGPLTIPNTGDYQSWTTVRKTGVSLAAGQQVWRLVVDSPGPTGVSGNFNYIRATADGTIGGSSSAFGGTPARLPGTIQAENFDEGAAGAAYHDTTSGNSGGQYRSTNVDIEVTADSGGGYNVGWTAAGEWLKYTVDVAAAGTYTLEFRVAARAPGATFHLEVNGVDKTGPLTIPNTGSYQTWATVTKTGVSLAAGEQVWRLVVDAAGTVLGNFNYIRVTAAGTGGASSPYLGTPATLPGTVQAENFDNGGEGVAYHDISSGNRGGQYRATDVDIESSLDSDGGYSLGYARAGEWLKYTVNVAAAGTYDLDLRVASNGQGGTLHVEANGADRTGPITIPDTGGWWSWTTIRRTGISLGAGPQVLRLVMDANGPTTFVGNINWFRVASTGTSAGVTLVRAPYLQQVTDDSAIVVWTTREGGAGAVRYSGAGGTSTTVPASTQLFSSAQTGLAFDFYQHEARLLNLSAGSSYTYDVLLNGQDATPGQDSFRTAPPNGSGTVRFIAFGDSGVGSTAQAQLAARIASDTFNLAIHAGDVAYGNENMVGGGTYRQYDEWFFSVYAPWLRSRPAYPSIGNHDDEVGAARPYRDVFVLPENGGGTFPDHAERYYSFDYGPVHFVALDTETAFNDSARRQAQITWLESDLASTSQPWRVVYFHRSPYSSGGEHGSDLRVRQAFSPIFERYGVQLVISAHDHDYERSVPWREFVAGGSAVTYVVSGGGGAALYPVGSGPWTAASAALHHYVRVSADACTLTGEAVGISGAVFDTFQIRRCQ